MGAQVGAYPFICYQCGKQALSFWPETNHRICANCTEIRESRRAAIEAALFARYPTVDYRTRVTLARGFGDLGLARLLSADDQELLRVRNFGPKMLQVFRACVPPPYEDVLLAHLEGMTRLRLGGN